MHYRERRGCDSPTTGYQFVFQAGAFPSFFIRVLLPTPPPLQHPCLLSSQTCDEILSLLQASWQNTTTVRRSTAVRCLLHLQYLRREDISIAVGAFPCHYGAGCDSTWRQAGPWPSLAGCPFLGDARVAVKAPSPRVIVERVCSRAWRVRTPMRSSVPGDQLC